jgi:hypothetical protein
MTTLEELAADRDARYTVAGYRGIAFYFHGLDTEPDEDTEWSGLEVETGMAVMVMVGDDREHIVDPDDVTLIADADYCAGCGQVGCQADARAV